MGYKAHIRLTNTVDCDISEDGGFVNIEVLDCDTGAGMTFSLTARTAERLGRRVTAAAFSAARYGGE